MRLAGIWGSNGATGFSGLGDLQTAHLCCQLIHCPSCTWQERAVGACCVCEQQHDSTCKPQFWLYLCATCTAAAGLRRRPYCHNQPGCLTGCWSKLTAGRRQQRQHLQQQTHCMRRCLVTMTRRTQQQQHKVECSRCGRKGGTTLQLHREVRVTCGALQRVWRLAAGKASSRLMLA